MRKELMEDGKQYLIQYNGTYDIIFKKLFQKTEIAARVIGSIINEEVKPEKLVYIDSVQANMVNCKSETFDVTLEIMGNVNEYIDLEMQRSKRDYVLADRLLTNLSAMITNETEKGARYGGNKYYSICFTSYPLKNSQCIVDLFKEIADGIKCAQIYLVDLTKLEKCDKLKLKEILEIVNGNTLQLIK